jgi:hypothetical protein
MMQSSLFEIMHWETLMRGPMLFALAYNYIPELAARRQQYEIFWLLIAGAAIAGLVLLRRWTRDRQQNSGSSRQVFSIASVFSLLGGYAAWNAWLGGWLYWHWGTESRELVESVTFVVLGVAWGAILGIAVHATLHRLRSGRRMKDN